MIMSSAHDVTRPLHERSRLGGGANDDDEVVTEMSMIRLPTLLLPVARVDVLVYPEERGLAGSV